MQAAAQCESEFGLGPGPRGDWAVALAAHALSGRSGCPVRPFIIVRTASSAQLRASAGLGHLPKSASEQARAWHHEAAPVGCSQCAQLSSRTPRPPLRPALRTPPAFRWPPAAGECSAPPARLPEAAPPEAAACLQHVSRRYVHSAAVPGCGRGGAGGWRAESWPLLPAPSGGRQAPAEQLGSCRESFSPHRPSTQCAGLQRFIFGRSCRSRHSLLSPFAAAWRAERGLTRRRCWWRRCWLHC